MNRLTEKRDSGSWGLKGVDWKQIAPGAKITDEVWRKLYGALYKLKDYEDTGLMPDEIGKLNAETQEEARKMLEKVAKLSEKIEKAQERTRWIPVTERFPEPGDYVLLSFPDFSVPAIGRYDEDEEGGAFFIGDETESSQDMFVNAWMPLPEPYTEGKE